MFTPRVCVDGMLFSLQAHDETNCCRIRGRRAVVVAARFGSVSTTSKQQLMAQDGTSEQLNQQDKLRCSAALDLAIQHAQASAGAIWWQVDTRAHPRELQLIAQRGFGRQRIDAQPAAWAGHDEHLQDVLRAGEAKLLQARFEFDDGEPSAWQLFITPVGLGEKQRGVLELFVPVQVELATDRIVGEIQNLFEFIDESNSVTDRQGDTTQPDRHLGSQVSGQNTRSQLHETDAALAQWLSKIHQSLELEETAVALANETRTLLKWDRVAVFAVRGRHARLLAVSGLSGFDRRSPMVRVLETLAGSLRHLRQAVEIPAEDAVANRETGRSTLQKYLDEQELQRVLAIPLLRKNSSSCLGILLAETHHSAPCSLWRTAPQLTENASRAFEHAWNYSRARTPVWQRPWKLLNGWMKVLVATLFLCAGIVALCRIPTDLVIHGRGTLTPTRQRDLFAGTNAIIRKVHVTHGAQVTEGDVLIELRSPDLELERQQVQGELDTIKQQIADIETLRNDPRRNLEAAQNSLDLAARGEELKTVSAALQTQLKLLDQQLEELVLTSPLSGQVITWNLEQHLGERPVQRIDRLLTIADLQAGWQLEIAIDQRDIEPVVKAVHDKTARVEFLIPGETGRRYAAEVVELASAIRVDPFAEMTLQILADVKAEDLPAIRPGTSVLPRIDCGRQPIGYVWFRRLIHRVSNWWQLL